MPHVGESEVLNPNLIGVTHQEAGGRRLRAMDGGVHHPVEEMAVPGAPSLVPALVGRAGASGGDEEVHLMRGQLPGVPGLQVVQVDRQPRIRGAHPGGEGVQDAAETADRLVGDTVVHVHQADVKRVHGQNVEVWHRR